MADLFEFPKPVQHTPASQERTRSAIDDLSDGDYLRSIVERAAVVSEYGKANGITSPGLMSAAYILNRTIQRIAVDQEQ